MDPAAFFDNPMFTMFAFVPRTAAMGDSTLPAGSFVDGVLPGRAPGIQLGFRLYPHPRRSEVPCVVYFHGNAEVAPDYDDTYKLFHAAGASLLVVDFQGYGWSTGTPSITSLQPDADAAAAALPAALVDAGLGAGVPLILFGRSIGSVCAIHLAAARGDLFKALIVESGIASLLELPLVAQLAAAMPMLAPLVPLLPDPWNNTGKVAAVRLRTLIIHGDRDTIAPVAQGQQLFERCGSSARDKVLLRFPDAGHNDLIYTNRERYFAAVKEVVEGVAGAGAAAPEPSPSVASACNCL